MHTLSILKQILLKLFVTEQVRTKMWFRGLLCKCHLWTSSTCSNIAVALSDGSDAASEGEHSDFQENHLESELDLLIFLNLLPANRLTPFFNCRKRWCNSERCFGLVFANLVGTLRKTADLTRCPCCASNRPHRRGYKKTLNLCRWVF